MIVLGMVLSILGGMRTKLDRMYLYIGLKVGRGWGLERVSVASYGSVQLIRQGASYWYSIGLDCPSAFLNSTKRVANYSRVTFCFMFGRAWSWRRSYFLLSRSNTLTRVG